MLFLLCQFAHAESLPSGTAISVTELHGVPESEAAKLRGVRCTVVEVTKDGEWWSGTIRCPDGDHWYMFMKFDLQPVTRPAVERGQTAWVRSIREGDPDTGLIGAPCVIGEGSADEQGWWHGDAVCDGTPRRFTHVRWDARKGGQFPPGTRVRIVEFGPSSVHGRMRPDLVGKVCVTQVGTDDEPWWGGGLTCDGEEVFTNQVRLAPAP